MNCKIPFTKDIDFGKKVSEITSISLEHDITPSEGLLKGNFIVSGDFKSHEVSVNKEPFSYILPFEIDLTDDIDISTIEFMIEDFTYEIVNDTNLRVKIEFQVIASKKEVVEEPLFKKPEEILISDERHDSEILKEDITSKEEIKETEDTVIDSLDISKEEYTTYHIHMVSDGETIETICTMYNSNVNILGEYNDLSNISVGDKLVIPDINE